MACNVIKIIVVLLFCVFTQAQIEMKGVIPTAVGEIGVNEVTPPPLSELKGSIGVNTGTYISIWILDFCSGYAAAAGLKESS